MTLRIVFPRPCGESWRDMARADGGRQCARCDRRVVDFRAASDEEIVLAHAESDTPPCGAYSPEQVARWSGPILVSLTLSATLAGAATPAHGEPPRDAVHAAAPTAAPARDTSIVRGTVRDSAGAPLSGVYIRLEGTAVRTVTDSAGRYAVRVPGPADQVGNARLWFARLGYDGREVEVGVGPGEATEVDVVLTRAELHIVGIVATGYAHRSVWRRLLDRIGRIF